MYAIVIIFRSAKEAGICKVAARLSFSRIVEIGVLTNQKFFLKIVNIICNKIISPRP